MNKIKKLLFVFIIIFTFVMFIACKKKAMNGGYTEYYRDSYTMDATMEAEMMETFAESYNESKELPIVDAQKNNESYFSMDSSTAGYSNFRRLINSGQKEITVRTDEMLNYFTYGFDDTDEDFVSFSEIALEPWNTNKFLLTISIKTKEVNIERYSQGNNFVFLIDVSGSMNGEYRLDLVKKSMKLLVENLNEDDTISIVTYASGIKTVCSGIKVIQKSLINGYIDSLQASGGTAGGEGLKTAYSVCEENLIQGGNNRIIICSDGDFNVGINNTEQLKELMKSKLELGIYVTTLGFGMFNYRDDMMETIAKYGNGVFAFIDSIQEAKKVLVDEMDNSLCAVAKDVKSKVVFNTDIVKSYRLIGYENKTITKEDYEDDTYDGLELGSNSEVMVCYELELFDSSDLSNMFTLDIKYKDPLTNENKTYQNTFKGLEAKNFEETSKAFKFASCIVEFSLVLRNSKYKENASIKHVLETLNDYELCDDDYKTEFKELIIKYNNIK